MKVKKNRNYWLSFLCSCACYFGAFFTGDFQIERFVVLVAMVFNTGIWLIVAWMFDDYGRGEI